MYNPKSVQPFLKLHCQQISMLKIFSIDNTWKSFAYDTTSHLSENIEKYN